MYLQIQDASNHLMAAMSLLAAPPMRFDEQESKFDFQSAEEVIQVKTFINPLFHLENHPAMEIITSKLLEARRKKGHIS